jgi:hypothetical protein
MTRVFPKQCHCALLEFRVFFGLAFCDQNVTMANEYASAARTLPAPKSS